MTLNAEQIDLNFHFDDFLGLNLEKSVCLEYKYFNDFK